MATIINTNLSASDVSILTSLINGVNRNVDISSKTLVTTSVKIGGGVSNTELTKAILDRLISTQNGSDLDATYHTHNGQYFTKTELRSALVTSGSSLIGDDNTYTHFTPTAATIKGALAGIDSALSGIGGGGGGYVLKTGDIMTGRLIVPSINDSADVISADFATRVLQDSFGGIISLDWGFRTLSDGSEILSVDWNSRLLYGTTGLVASLDWANRALLNTSGVAALSWDVAGELNANSNKITNLGSPLVSTDAATKQYVDDSVAAVPSSPAMKKTMVAGESFAANTTYFVRMAKNGETAGRIYKADYDATTADNFYAIGVIEGNGAAAKIAGDSVVVTIMGTATLGSADTLFNATKVGEAAHLITAGAFDAVSNITYTTNQASYRVGIVEDTNKILVAHMQLLGVV